MTVLKLSEEHGFVARQNFDLPIGSMIRINPNHSCAVANLADFYTIVNDDQMIDRWEIIARGKVY